MAEAQQAPVGRGTSAIEWTEDTWNPVTGCDRVSPGCAHCYALDLAARLRKMGNAKYVRARDGGRSSGPAFGVTLHKGELAKPLGWRRPRLVFVCSMSDLFHDEVPAAYIARVFAVMAATPRHTYQVLTKRPHRMRALLLSQAFHAAVDEALADVLEQHRLGEQQIPWPLPNVWCGVTIENRRFVSRAHVLRETPAAVRFISAEPLLGPLMFDARSTFDRRVREWSDGHPTLPELDLTGIDWLIAGGESGPDHRPMPEEWVRDLRDACLREAERRPWPGDGGITGPAFFFKQWGGRTPKAGGRELDGRTWDEMPERLEAAA